ncbi:uncharacterized protein LOC8278858 isoform X2 [Ricinus communis]|uniref:uncharacterized protein LOC8278858 isoform X2 n=1 Tax=Ricinus communis TaxID=3988 RepID=UPI000D6881F2|nr:uncharacterized protein LOC8278858 isoform X2 [Ricinus communis]|eukprot:XP_025013458.1 uncharacterized protein LOC8278858 isoform X2 [Ricinus communis]
MEIEGHAIRALGSLFKLTEVYIWEDGSTETREICLFPESTSDYDDTSSNITDLTRDFSEVPEGLELTKQMDALGLPVSFQSNKKTRNNRMNKSRRNGKLSCRYKEAKDEALEFMKENELVTLSDVASNDEIIKGLSSSYLDAPPSPVCQLKDVSVDHGEKKLGGSLESECLSDSSATHNHKQVRRLHSEESTQQAGGTEIIELSQNSEVLECNRIETHGYNDNLRDWRVYWDNYYMRNYFYNIQTGTSTWDPPAGMEHLAFDSVTDVSNGAIVEVTENNDAPSTSSNSLNYFKRLEEHPNDDGLIHWPSDKVSVKMIVTANSNLPEMIVPENDSFELQDELQRISTSCDDEITSCLAFEAQENSSGFTSMITNQVLENDKMQMESCDPATDKLYTQPESGMTKQKRKARKTLAHKKSSNSEDLQCEEIFEHFSANIDKYWHQRYLLFSRFDNGIRMDEEGWFSVTPEPIARHQAIRCASDAIIDCFTGVGGNAIQFAQRCKHVIAIDVDPKKIDYAYHNASIYGVADQIDFITGDFFNLAPKLKADTVFLSPPWGGPDYAKVKTYNIITMLRPQDGYTLFNTAKKIARKVVMFLPRNTDFNQLAELTLSSDHPWSLEVEKNYLNGKLKAITAYFSDTIVEGTDPL